MWRYQKRGSVQEIVKKEAKFHKKCYTQYDQNHFHPLPSPPMERSSQSEEFGPTSLKRSKRVSLLLRETVCFYFQKT